MQNASNRKFKCGETVYVVDYWGGEAFKAEAEIIKVYPEESTFTAVLYGDTYQEYSFKDYGRLIFDTEQEAVKEAEKFPEPGSTVYQVVGNRIDKKVACWIEGAYTTSDVYDLVIQLDKEGTISSKELGHTLFVSEAEARKNTK